MLLTIISCAWILGIWLGSIFPISSFFTLTSLLPLPFIVIFKNKRKLFISITLGLLFFFTGTSLAPILNHSDSSIAAFNNKDTIEFTGIISEPPEKRETTNILVISVMDINGEPVHGKVIYCSFSYTSLRYGDIITGHGIFESPVNSAGFDFRAYLAGEGISSIARELDYRVIERGKGSPFMAGIFDLRERLAYTLASALPEPQASLAQGIVLGIRTNISKDFKSDISLTGTSHLLAISGQNLSIIVGLLLALGLYLFGRRNYFYIWMTLGIIWIYAIFTGLQVPVIRSAIMATIFLITEMLGRQKNAFPALILSAAIMVTLSPYVLSNLSFKLSFLSMAGLISITPFFRNLGRKAINDKLGEEGLWSKTLVFVTDSLSVSLGAMIAVWPIISYTFGIISFVGPITTFLISPVLAPIIIFGTLAAFAGLINPSIAQIIGWVAWLFLSYMTVIIEGFSVLPAAYIKNGPFSPILIWLYFGILYILINKQTLLTGFNIKRIKEAGHNSIYWMDSVGNFIGKKAKYVLPPLIMVAALCSLAAASMPGTDLKVSFLDVGEGDSILIQANGRYILIDGGPSGQMICSGLGAMLPFWERKIDLVILTHPHSDHMNGLFEVSKRYRVERALLPPVNTDLPLCREWLQLIKSKHIEYMTAQAGQQILLNDGAVLEILSSPDNLGASNPDPDENAIVARLSYGLHSFLFTSDIGKETEKRLLLQRRINNSEILKIAHHGSDRSSSIEFLEAVNPSVAVISMGNGNQFGHPAPGVLQRISSLGIKNIYRTDLDGTITFSLDSLSPDIRVKTNP